MNPRNDDLSPDEIEQLLYQADQFVDSLFPQTEADVAEMETIFGSTSVELPERLRKPEAVLDRIIRRQEPVAQKPSPFGTLVTMLRTEKRLSIDQLARKTDLDADDLRQLESGHQAASPLAVTVLAEFFRLKPQKVMRMAGLTRESSALPRESLSVAACAKPNFDALDAQERAVFHALVKQLRK